LHLDYRGGHRRDGVGQLVREFIQHLMILTTNSGVHITRMGGCHTGLRVRSSPVTLTIRVELRHLCVMSGFVRTTTVRQNAAGRLMPFGNSNASMTRKQVAPANSSTPRETASPGYAYRGAALRAAPDLALRARFPVCRVGRGARIVPFRDPFSGHFAVQRISESRWPERGHYVHK
jgi:hypothetical protein